MTQPTTRIFIALAASAALLAALPAAAHGNRWNASRWDGPSYGHAWGHHKYRAHHDERRVIRERVIVERPVVREYYYDAPPVRYRYAREPSIVIGVSLPPIVIPIR